MRKAHLGKMNAGRSRHPFDYQEFKARRFRWLAWLWFLRRPPARGEG